MYYICVYHLNSEYKALRCHVQTRLWRLCMIASGNKDETTMRAVMKAQLVLRSEIIRYAITVVREHYFICCLLCLHLSCVDGRSCLRERHDEVWKSLYHETTLPKQANTNRYNQIPQHQTRNKTRLQTPNEPCSDADKQPQCDDNHLSIDPK